MGIMLGQIYCGQGVTKTAICPTFEPKSNMMTSKEPINSSLINAINIWHVQMVIINDFGVVVLSMVILS
jgi:hypothetical protein